MITRKHSATHSLFFGRFINSKKPDGYLENIGIVSYLQSFLYRLVSRQQHEILTGFQIYHYLKKIVSNIILQKNRLLKKLDIQNRFSLFLPTHHQSKNIIVSFNIFGG